MEPIGFVDITELDGPTLRNLYGHGVRFECLAIPQIGHHLVVTTVTEDSVSFYNVGLVTGLAIM